MASRKVWIASFLVLAVVIFAGYLLKATGGDSKSPTTVATQTDIGIIDMNKALKAHPKYQELVRLKKELNTLAAQDEEAQNFTTDNRVPAGNQGALDDAMQQKQNEALIAKHAEINERLKRKNKDLTDQFEKEFDAEVVKINAYYQPMIFDLKLKLETANITEEARKELNEKRMNLDNERTQKIGQKQQEFKNKINAIMEEESKKGEIELAAERKQIEEATKAEKNVQQEKINTRNNQEMSNQNEIVKLDVNQIAKGKEAGIYKEQEIAVLEESMKNDILGKVAKIAIEKKLVTVLAAVEINVSAMDITDLVIAEFKK
ncbi:MAG: outer rane chaperone Skp (OmpH) [Firmicutes bacterium]|nr:outer rane chaperone Skp (OmpH) [Bacillota bacterium]